ncbi:hypothetical protein [Nocardioides ochotonae]|uniref:hypothetical protein n=1 Tax=Nocardioides ochotonae TaxID=2685869 RepID=UPI0014075FD3|nr:hypothetical protein [Nocardioides ochotonae]
MSREPSSPMMRGWRAFAHAPEPPPTPAPKPGKRKFTVTVEPRRKRNANKTRWKDLTPEEMASFRIHPEDQT